MSGAHTSARSRRVINPVAIGHIVRAQLHKYGITLRSVTEPIDETPTGKLMENIASAFAQYDNNLRAQRTKVGMQAKLAAGGWPFQAPLGYLQTGSGRNSQLIHDPERAPLIKQAFELIATRVHTPATALDVVTRSGLLTRKQKPVSWQTFYRMLRNPVYSGWVEVPDWSVRYRGAFESIVSDEVFDMVQAVLSGRRPVVAPYSRNSPEFPLRRFVRCGRCGTALTASFSTGRKRVRHPYYHCRKRGCGGVSVRREDIEQQFVNLLDAVRPKPEYLRLFKAVVLDVWKEKRPKLRRSAARQSVVCRNWRKRRNR